MPCAAYDAIQRTAKPPAPSLSVGGRCAGDLGPYVRHAGPMILSTWSIPALTGMVISDDVTLNENPGAAPFAQSAKRGRVDWPAGTYYRTCDDDPRFARSISQRQPQKRNKIASHFSSASARSGGSGARGRFCVPWRQAWYWPNPFAPRPLARASEVIIYFDHWTCPPLGSAPNCRRNAPKPDKGGCPYARQRR